MNMQPWLVPVGSFTAALLASLACANAAATATAPPAAAADPALVASEFIAATPPTPSSHASTIVETPAGLVAAWFGGTQEGATDVGIWLSRKEADAWTAPEEVATGIDVKQYRRYPCWNPVLTLRRGGQLLLFYKVGPSPSSWWGMVRTSPDYGKNWVRVRKLPSGFVGPVRNKPYELANGVLLCGASSEDRGWRVHMEKTEDPFLLWERSPTLNAAYTVAAIQPTILRYPDNRFQILCRTKQGRVWEAWSDDAAESWGPMTRTSLPNPNSALDGVVLEDGRALLVYNHATEGRGTLNVAVSRDGKNWQAASILENEAGAEFSYPAVIQTRNGLVHVTYTWKRQKIKHVILDPSRLQLRDIVDGRWPAN